MSVSLAYNMDCMEALREMPDNAFDLACVDTPYGNVLQNEMNRERGGSWASAYGNNERTKLRLWDIAPGEDYFKELFRVSRNQIIWGGNYFRLPPTRCFLIWRKTNVPEKFTMAMAEYAWTSFNENAKVFDFSAVGQAGRFHPTQKPPELYRWIFHHYAKPGDKIIDTHLGSGSSRIAAYDAGLDFVGYEIDKEYFDKQEKRFAEHSAQLNLFLGG